MYNIKLSTIKRYLLDTNDGSNYMLKNTGWNEGYVIGLHFANYIDEQEFEHMMDWIKSNPNFGSIDKMARSKVKLANK